MTIYSRELMPFDQYLEHARSHPDAIAQSMRDLQKQQLSLLEQGFGKMIAGHRTMTGILSAGFGILSLQLGGISRNLQNIAQGIEDLHADFNWAMGEIMFKLDLQQQSLKDILATLQAPLDSQAKELRKRAEYAYQQGWYEDALTDFLESEKKNYQDFTIYHAIANIFLYRQKPPNVDKAREYYLKLAKYATPVSPYHAALGYMYAGFTCYLQRNDTAAIQHAEKATQLYPKLTETFYNHAKFAAAASKAEVAIPSLETAIRADRKYAVKARADSDFVRVEAAIFALMTKLRDEAKTSATRAIAELEKQFAGYDFFDKSIEDKAYKLLAEANEHFLKHTYFGYLDAVSTTQSARQLFEKRTVKIKRENIPGVGDAGRYNIMLDGRRIGTLGNQETIEVQAQRGRHTVQIGWIFFRSNVLEFDLTDDIQLVCGENREGLIGKAYVKFVDEGET